MHAHLRSQIPDPFNAEASLLRPPRGMQFASAALVLLAAAAVDAVYRAPAPACQDWCNKYTCENVDCQGCSVPECSEDSAPGCEDWCSSWTCNQPKDCGGCPVCMPRPPPPPLLPNAFPRNPFESVGGWYVNPSLTENLRRTIASVDSGPGVAVLEKMKRIPSAFWIDNKAKIRGSGLDTLEGILADAASHAEPPLCVFIFYDLPNRDCSAMASAGEISHGNGAGAAAAALRVYKEQYVDEFAAVLAKHSRVPVVLVLEPDSLGNVISNEGAERCSGETVANYKEGITYAVQTLSARAPHVGLYIDAAHGGWMGYEGNAAAFTELIASLDVLPHIRGFSVNVANYQTVGLDNVCPEEAFADTGAMVNGATGGVAEWCKGQTDQPCCSYDPCRLQGSGSGGASELRYVQTLRQHFLRRTGWAPHFVIDTGRNGAPEGRASCETWCNVRGAGAGHVPTMNTPLPHVVDALFWRGFLPSAQHEVETRERATGPQPWPSRSRVISRPPSETRSSRKFAYIYI